MYTIEAIRRIKAEIPGAFTTLGVSNVSFGLSPAARHVLNSVFLHECVQAGLDSAIVHAGKIVPLAKIPDEQRDVCLDLIYDRRGMSADGTPYDPLQQLLEVFADVKSVKTVEGGPLRLAGRGAAEAPHHRRRPRRPDRRARRGDGRRAQRAGHHQRGPARRHARRRRAVRHRPDAAALRAAVGRDDEDRGRLPRAPHGAASAARRPRAGSCWRRSRATCTTSARTWSTSSAPTTATRSTTSGSRSAISDMVAKVKEVDADALGMSGLLVKSTLIMRENLEELNALGLTEIPVLLGGAALTRSYVERDLRGVYEGRLFYGRDAFEGLRTLDDLMRDEAERLLDDPDFGRVPDRPGAARPLQARRGRRRRAARPLARGRARQPGLPAAVRRQPGREGPVARRHRRSTSTRPRCSATSGSTGPSPARATRTSRPASGPCSASTWPRRRPAACSCPRSSTGTSRSTGRRRPRRLDRRGRAPRSWRGSRSPASARRRSCASPTSSGPDGGAGEVDYAAFHIVTMGGDGQRGDGRALRRQPLPGVPAAPRARRRDGRGAGRVLAPPHPRRVGLRRRGRPDRSAASSASSTAAAATRGATRPAPTWRTTPRWPSCSAPSASASRSARRRAGSTSPSRPPRAIICHHPQAKYFVAR